MRQRRGRRSAASLSVVPIDAIQRPKPPESMSEAGKQLWRDTVSTGQRFDDDEPRGFDDEPDEPEGSPAA